MAFSFDASRLVFLYCSYTQSPDLDPANHIFVPFLYNRPELALSAEKKNYT